jgi:hypothetical protein
MCGSDLIDPLFCDLLPHMATAHAFGVRQNA